MAAHSNLRDHELAALLQGGDQMAFTVIYHRYERLLFLHAYKKLHDPDEAKDVVQELFTNLWNKHETLVSNISLSGYLYASLRNRIINMMAHKGIESEYVSAIQAFASQKIYSATDEMVRYNELLTLIDREIAKLPKKMRMVFEMSRMEQLSHKEIAGRTGLSEATVKKQVQNALKIIKPKITMIVLLSHFIS
jgi:RNA polymerase sigma-70 factor (family 1)